MQWLVSRGRRGVLKIYRNRCILFHAIFYSDLFRCFFWIKKGDAILWTLFLPVIKTSQFFKGNTLCNICMFSNEPNTVELSLSFFESKYIFHCLQLIDFRFGGWFFCGQFEGSFSPSKNVYLRAKLWDMFIFWIEFQGKPVDIHFPMVVRNKRLLKCKITFEYN